MGETRRREILPPRIGIHSHDNTLRNQPLNKWAADLVFVYLSYTEYGFYNASQRNEYVPSSLGDMRNSSAILRQSLIASRTSSTISLDEIRAAFLYSFYFYSLR
jgi:hypothetical protein